MDRVRMDKTFRALSQAKQPKRGEYQQAQPIAFTFFE